MPKAPNGLLCADVSLRNYSLTDKSVWPAVAVHYEAFSASILTIVASAVICTSCALLICSGPDIASAYL